ncbi:MAG: hypothetical protein V9E98_00255 [Candidatus Nanopelagicales bacterium]
MSYVRFRDTGQITAILLQMWFFVTPVIYPIDLIPEDARGVPLRALIELNPMTALVQISRDLIYGLTLARAPRRSPTWSAGRCSPLGRLRSSTDAGVKI